MTLPQRPEPSPDYGGRMRLALVAGTLATAALIVLVTGSTNGLEDLAALVVAVSAVIVQVHRRRRR